MNINGVIKKEVVDIINSINDAWVAQNEFHRKTCEQVILIGKYLLDADRYFTDNPNDDELLFNESLPFPQSTISKYKRIASNPVLSNDLYLSSLPHSMATMYELSIADHDLLQNGIEKGIINCDISRSEAIKFVKENLGTGSISARRGAPVKRVANIEYSQVNIPKMLDEEDQDLLWQELCVLKAKYGLSVKLSKSQSDRLKNKLRQQAEETIQGIVQECDQSFDDSKRLEKQRIRGVVEHAIHNARTNKERMVTDKGLLLRISKELGLDASNGVKLSQLYKYVRENKIVNRFTPISDYHPIAYVCSIFIDIVDGDSKALKKLNTYIEDNSQISPEHEKARSLALDVLSQIESF